MTDKKHIFHIFRLFAFPILESYAVTVPQKSRPLAPFNQCEETCTFQTPKKTDSPASQPISAPDEEARLPNLELPAACPKHKGPLRNTKLSTSPTKQELSGIPEGSDQPFTF